jgi:hypothetical protein
MEQHEWLEKLNLQAHQSARAHSDEFVLEAFITFDKLPCLIRDLLLVDVWREQVLPLLLDDISERRATMRAYFVLYHEATVINLLEVSEWWCYKRLVGPRNGYCASRGLGGRS